MPKHIGWHHYPTVENENYLTGSADLYYDAKAYYEARLDWLQNGNRAGLDEMDKHFNRVQYVIYKENNVPTEMILLEHGLMLNWDTEIELGLDRIVVRHLWIDAPKNAYRFAHRVEIEPIGMVRWLAPDIFKWNKNDNPRFEETSDVKSPLCANTEAQTQPPIHESQARIRGLQNQNLR